MVRPSWQVFGVSFSINFFCFTIFPVFDSVFVLSAKNCNSAQRFEPVALEVGSVFFSLGLHF